MKTAWLGDENFREIGGIELIFTAVIFAASRKRKQETAYGDEEKRQAFYPFHILLLDLLKSLYPHG